ncbi:hypothetical protein LXL04_013095 [Taraxacum kok-saghyz]
MKYLRWRSLTRTKWVPISGQKPIYSLKYSKTTHIFCIKGCIVFYYSIVQAKVGPDDVIIVRSPESPRKVVTKRIIGMEGDTITYIVDPKNSDTTETIVV